jgi:hypothetical protein
VIFLYIALLLFGVAGSTDTHPQARRLQKKINQVFPKKPFQDSASLVDAMRLYNVGDEMFCAVPYVDNCSNLVRWVKEKDSEKWVFSFLEPIHLFLYAASKKYEIKEPIFQSTVCSCLYCEQKPVEERDVYYCVVDINKE